MVCTVRTVCMGCWMLSKFLVVVVVYVVLKILCSLFFVINNNNNNNNQIHKLWLYHITQNYTLSFFFFFFVFFFFRWWTSLAENFLLYIYTYIYVWLMLKSSIYISLSSLHFFCSSLYNNTHTTISIPNTRFIIETDILESLHLSCCTLLSRCISL